jgi:hypothetical protein
MTGLVTGSAWTTMAVAFNWIRRTRPKPGPGQRYKWRGTATSLTIFTKQMLALPPWITAYHVISLKEAASSLSLSYVYNLVKSKRVTLLFYWNSNPSSVSLRHKMNVVLEYFRTKFKAAHGLRCTLMALNHNITAICIHQMSLNLN